MKTYNSVKFHTRVLFGDGPKDALFTEFCLVVDPHQVMTYDML